ncbi:extracellular solute-binding protein [Bacillus carboniphilus]|uniref:Extracellular solute-binding protein n=1 Tax=Bacillus carboniphilus TaxID=86663 RepID=A0ABN0WA41_9BACI
MKIKGFLLVVMLMFASILVIACSSDSSDGDTTEKDTENESNENVTENESEKDPVELVMYSWRPEDREMYEEAIAAFNEQYPHINVVFQPYKSTEYNTILTNALVSGEGPDIIQLRPYSGAETIADNGYIMPLDDLPGIENINEQYLDAARGTDGKVYGVPLSLNSGVIWYNTKLFEENGIDIPTTWEEFLAACEELKQNDIIPIAQSGRAAYVLSLLHGVVAPTAYDGNEFVTDVLENGATLEDSRFVESVERMQELVPYFPENFIALEDNDAKTLFFTEQAAMYINGDYRLATFEETAPDLPIGVIPGLAAEKGEDPVVMTWVDGSYAAVQNTDHPEEAKLFMEFLASQEFGKIFSDGVNRLSAINGVEAEHPIVKQIAAASDKSATPYLMLVHFGEGEPTTKTVFENALQGMFLGEISIEDVIKQAQENADRAAAE